MASLAAINVLQILENADKSATLFINSLNCPISDSFWSVMSLVKLWFPMYIIIAIFFYLRLNWKKATIMLIACILTVVICDQTANFTKEFFARLRPCFDVDMLRGGLNILEGRGNLYGFYSAHAANTMGFALISYLAFRHDKSKNYTFYKVFIFTWASLVGLSRIFVGKHFLGDVIVGMAFGLFVSYILSVIANKIIAILSKH